MRKYILLLLSSLLFMFYEISLAKGSPMHAYKQAQAFLNSQEIVTHKTISEAKKNVIKTFIVLIKKSCGNFNAKASFYSSAKCTKINPKTGERVTYEMSCQQGKYCKFTKVKHVLATMKTTPTSYKVKATPNVPSQSAVGLGKWMKIFSGLIYVALTIYLLLLAISNLFKREILFLIIDLSLWAILTATMYVVMGGF